MKSALERAGASITDVVRTRMFVTDISQWEAIGRAHGEFFREIKPVATMVEVQRLIDPEMLVEIEADAVLADQRAPVTTAVGNAECERLHNTLLNFTSTDICRPIGRRFR